MERDTLQTAMMAIMLTAMDAAEIVILKSDSHVMAGHQTLKMLAVPFFHQQSQFKTEDNQDFSENLFLTSDSITYQQPS
jgi:hypothetical protein